MRWQSFGKNIKKVLYALLPMTIMLIVWAYRDVPLG